MWFDSPLSALALLGLIPWFLWTARSTRPRDWVVGSVAPFCHLAAKQGKARRRWPISAWVGGCALICVSLALAGPRFPITGSLVIIDSLPTGQSSLDLMRQIYDLGAGREVRLYTDQPEPTALPRRVKWIAREGWANDYGPRAAILSVRPASGGRWAIHYAVVGQPTSALSVSLLGDSVDLPDRDAPGALLAGKHQGVVYLPHPPQTEIAGRGLHFEILDAFGNNWGGAWSTYHIPLPLFLLPPDPEGFWSDTLQATLPGSRANSFGGITTVETPIVTLRTSLEHAPKQSFDYREAEIVFDGDPFEQMPALDAASRVAEKVRAWLATTPDGHRVPYAWWPVSDRMDWPENIWPDASAWPSAARDLLLAGMLLFAAAMALMSRGR